MLEIIRLLKLLNPLLKKLGLRLIVFSSFYDGILDKEAIFQIGFSSIYYIDLIALADGSISFKTENRNFTLVRTSFKESIYYVPTRFIKVI